MRCDGRNGKLEGSAYRSGGEMGGRKKGRQAITEYNRHIVYLFALLTIEPGGRHRSDLPVVARHAARQLPE